MKFLLSVLLPILCLLYALSTLPGEWYGDIDIVHEYVGDILSGTWPWRYSLSAGPLYHYLIAPLIAGIGTSYTSYKIASVLIGIVSLVASFGFVTVFAPRVLAYIYVLLLGTSFWFLAWARTGNSQILIVGLTSLTCFFALRWVRFGKTMDVLLGTAVSGLGLFVYPQSWVLPLVFGVALLYQRRLRIREIVGVAGIGIVYAWGVYRVISASTNVFFGGYIGSKFWPMFSESPFQMLGTMWVYGMRTLGMLHIRGDDLFRVNIPGHPALDRVSGMLFVIGLLSISRLRVRQIIGLVIIVILLILPSISPALPSGEIPNSGRTIGVLPLVYVVITYGLLGIHTFVRRWNTHFATGVTGVLCCVIVYSNIYQYFVVYKRSLPDQNTPWSTIVGSYIDSIPLEIPVYLTSCCWRIWGQPNPKAIYYQLQHAQVRQTVMQTIAPTCEFVSTQKPAVYIGSPDGEWISTITACEQHFFVVTHTTPDGRKAFTSVEVQRL